MVIETRNILFYIGYILFLIGQLLGHTLVPISSQVRYVLIGVGGVCVGGQFVYSLLQKRYSTFSKQNIIFFILFFIVSVISMVKSNESIVVLDFLFILAAKDVDFDKILKIFIITATTLLFFTVICNAFGITETVNIQRGNIVRHTFGYRFPTDFVQLIVYILLADLVLCIEHHKNIFERIILYILLGLFSLVYSDARLGSATIFLLVPTILLLRYGKRVLFSKPIKILEKYIFLLCTVLTIFIMNKFISGGSNLLIALDKFTSYRLTNTDMGIKFFGYTLWGQEIYSNIEQFFKGWFYIDSSYYVFLLQYGSVLLILVEIGYIWSIRRCINLRNYIIPFICIFIALDSLIDQQFYLLEYNVFLLIPLTNINSQYVEVNKEAL